ncbi:MAG TPA: hypothetical protein EYQ26_00305 [Rhodospirillales bacterium]|nr:hypothetical protein [Rhodospirillales bacterium]
MVNKIDNKQLIHSQQLSENELGWLKLEELKSLGTIKNKIKLSHFQYERILNSYEELIDVLERGKNPIYGVHTSYGENARNKIDPAQWENTQRDLFSFLHVGIGDHLPEAVVRRALRLQIKKLSLGLSGVHPDSLADLLALSDDKKLPKVPSQGSLGASGDLISMAHAIAPLLNRIPRGPRDVICMVNTNSMMSSLAIENISELKKLMDFSYLNIALVAKSTKTPTNCFLGKGLEVGNVPKSYANAGRKILNKYNSLLSNKNNKKSSTIQPRYSIRCSPQIMGNCEDLLDFSMKKIIEEAVAIADNPLIINSEGEYDAEVWHGGLFYASGIATAGDMMVDIINKIAEMLDRQNLILMSSHLNSGLPDNLNIQGAGHLKGIHILTSSIVQKIKCQSTPGRNLSFSCEGNNQDLVPCGMTIHNNVSNLLSDLKNVLKCSLFSSLRAYSFLKQNELDPDLKLENWSHFSLDKIGRLV